MRARDKNITDKNVNMKKLTTAVFVCISALGAQAAEFRLATYNIKEDRGFETTPGRTWAERLPKIRRVCETHALDLVGYQELVREYQLPGLEKVFPEFGFIGSGRLKGQAGEGTFIMYRKSMFDLVKDGAFMLGEDPDAWGKRGWDAMFPRVCNWGFFRQKATGRTFYVFNTHLDCGPETARVKEIEQIVAEMKKMVPAGTPAFLLGDLNSVAKSQPIKVAEAHLDNAAKITQTPRKGPDRSWNYWEIEPKMTRGLFIDHILLSKLPEIVQVKGLEVLGDIYDGAFPSDHFPLVATIDLAPPAKSLKVLMIGNSFSASVLRHMPRVAKSMDLDLTLGSLFSGGCSLETHWNWCEKSAADPDYKPYVYELHVDGKGVRGGKAGLPEILASEKWDVVTIQQVSADAWRPETYRPFADDLIAKHVRRLAPQAKVVLQETWSYAPWDSRYAGWKLDPAGMYEKVRATCAEYASAHGMRVIPMGTAVQEWRKRLPVVYKPDSLGGDVVGTIKSMSADAEGKPVPKGDMMHLNVDGCYLQALVWTAALFGVDVTACPFAPYGMPAERVTLMKQIATDVTRR